MKSTLALSLGLAALVALGAALPAGAATTTTAAKPAAAATPVKPTHYYVELKAKGPGCEVVSVKPATKLMVGKHAFKTEADASKAMADSKACKV